MKIGIVPLNVGGPDAATQMIPLAQYAEAAGIESVWTFEHAMVPMNYESRYPYDKSGKMPISPEGWFIDPLISLAHVAAVTKTIRLGTGVNILPQTNPLLLAKQAASIDVLSGGRLLLGLGIGWLEEEFVAMGTPFERRGARFNDYIVAIVEGTRLHPDLRLGASPRASLHLMRAARVEAALAGRDYVIPEDVRTLAVSVLAHRVLPTVEAQVSRRDPEGIVGAIVEATSAPNRG